MVGVQDLTGGVHIHPLSGLFLPGQLQTHVQIVAQHPRLGGAVGLLFQPPQLLQELFLYRLGQLGLGNLLAVFKNLAVAVGVLPQLLLEDL